MLHRSEVVGSRAWDAKGRFSARRVRIRNLALLGLGASSAVFVWYMVANVAVAAPRVPADEARLHGWEAFTAAVIVAVFAVAVTAVVLRLRDDPATAPARPDPEGAAVWPRALRFQGVPRRIVLGVASVSVVAAVGAGLSGYPAWVVGAAVLLLWVPVGAWEVMWKYKHYGLYGFFVAAVAFQFVHMGEHTVQVVQLLVNNGDLGRSHGAFGQLDFELVHFISVTGLWFCLAFLLYVVRGRNVWLWVAFAVACLHEIEHIYLFWIYLGHRAFYDQGGFAGIMASGGVIGSPLARPYLHFTYNLLVVVPMAVALWEESTRVRDHIVARLPAASAKAG